jgi:exopolysaccharide production repressor protein
MYAPRVFASMVGALIAFGIATYFLTHSLSRTVIETVICAVLIQLGYFAGVLYLSWKEAKARRAQLGDGVVSAANRGEEKPIVLPAPGMNRSEPLNH